MLGVLEDGFQRTCSRGKNFDATGASLNNFWVMAEAALVPEFAGARILEIEARLLFHHLKGSW